MYCTRRDIWKRDIMVADTEELEIFGRVRNRCSETQCEGVHTPNNSEHSIFPYWRLLEGWWQSKPIRDMDWFHAVHNSQRKMVRWRLTINSKAQPLMARNRVRNVESCSTWRETALGYWRAEARQCWKVEEASTSSIRMTWNSKTPLKNAKKKLESSMDSATPCKVQDLGHGETCGDNKTQRSQIGIRMYRGSPRTWEKAHWKHTQQKIMKIALLERGSIRWVIATLCTSWSLCTKHWKSWTRKTLGTRSGKSSKNCQHGKCRK